MKSYLHCVAVTLAIGCILSVGSVGCKEKGPAEKTGERVDEIIDNVKEGEPPLKSKGPMEKLGESIDDATDKDKH